MEAAKLFYVVTDDKKVAYFVNNKEKLIDLLRKINDPDIRTFYTLEGAAQFIKNYNDNKDQNKNQQKVNTGTKMYLESQESPTNKRASTSVSHQANIKVNAFKTDEEIAKSADFGKPQGPQLKNKEDIYYYYQERDEDIAARRAKINPSDYYTLNFHGGAKPNVTGAADYEITTSNEERIYSDKITGLNKATCNEAIYCGLIYGLMTAANLGINHLNVQGQVPFIIEQMRGSNKVCEELKLFNKEAKYLVPKFSNIRFTFTSKNQ
jgi:hypothetical protein